MQRWQPIRAAQRSEGDDDSVTRRPSHLLVPAMFERTAPLRSPALLLNHGLNSSSATTALPSLALPTLSTAVR